MRRLDITIGLLSAATIFYGSAYAVSRERLRSTDLHQFYQQVNRESFRGELPDAIVKWADLPDEYGVTTFYLDGAEIGIDRASVTSEAQLLETMRHEACHVWTHEVVEETGQDWHGETWRGCMERFKN